MLVRGKCDCGTPVKRYADIDVKTGKITEKFVFCEKCRQTMQRVKALDAESWIDIKDPRKVERERIRDSGTGSTGV
jgi:hypothetical protein